jgi:hypothetical protein
MNGSHDTDLAAAGCRDRRKWVIDAARPRVLLFRPLGVERHEEGLGEPEQPTSSRGDSRERLVHRLNTIRIESERRNDERLDYADRPVGGDGRQRLAGRPERAAAMLWQHERFDDAELAASGGWYSRHRFVD